MTLPRGRTFPGLLVLALAGACTQPPAGPEPEPPAPVNPGKPAVDAGKPTPTPTPTPAMGSGGAVGSGGSPGAGGTGGGSGGAPAPAPTPADASAADPVDAAPSEAGTAPTGDAGGPGTGVADGFAQRMVTRAIGLAYYHSCIITPDKQVRCFGDKARPTDPRINPPGGLRADQIIGAHNGFCVTQPTGERLRCWGHNPSFFPPRGMNIDPIQVGIGYDHGCVLNANKSVTCWGQGGARPQPPAGLTAKAITVAAFFNCAIKEDDSVVCWGLEPPMPPAGLKAKIVAAVFHGNSKLPEAPGDTKHACAITLEDKVVCWGNEVEGNLTPPADLTVAKDIAVATYDSCALRPSGEPVCWGRKVYDNFDPVRYHKMPAGLRLKGIRANMAGYCGIKMEDDTVVCWGDEQHDHLTFPAGGVKAYVAP